jgi:hypothetical protein
MAASSKIKRNLDMSRSALPVTSHDYRYLQGGTRQEASWPYCHKNKAQAQAQAIQVTTTTRLHTFEAPQDEFYERSPRSIESNQHANMIVVMGSNYYTIIQFKCLVQACRACTITVACRQKHSSGWLLQSRDFYSPRSHTKTKCTSKTEAGRTRKIPA